LSASGFEAMAVIVVAYRSAEHLHPLHAALAPQLRDADELVIVDNASGDDTADVALSLGERVRVVQTGRNLGFAGGCHAGAEASRAPLLLFLNPDSVPESGCIEKLRDAALSHPLWGAWQAAVMLDDGRINTSGGVVHYLGIGWAGDCQRPADVLPAHDSHVTFPSGAAMVIRRDIWTRLHGLDRDYFMYGEDLDLGLRLWLAGYAVGLVPAARVVHRYEFDKGASKWFWLERNRWRTVLSVYPVGLLVLLAPALLVTELALLVIATREGWLRAKLRAQAATIGGLAGTIRRRRAVQRTRQIDAHELAERLTSSLDSPYLLGAASPAVQFPQALYWRVVRALLALFAR
jgi:hypothetical protein